MFSIASGSLVGFVLGMVGGGGSIIAMPLLLYVVGVGSAHLAIGTSAIAVSLSGSRKSRQPCQLNGKVKWPCAVTFSASGIAGALAGSTLAIRLPGGQLLVLFGLLMVVVGTVMFLRKDAEGNPDVRLRFKHGAPALAAAAAHRLLP